jgi:hypothetical protein
VKDWLDAFITAGRAVAAAVGIGALAAMLVAALFLQPAHAQLLMPDGKINTACNPTPRVPPLALPTPRLPPGLPKQFGGSCTEALVTADGTGAAIGWWCPKVTPEQAQLALYAVTWDAITLPMLVDAGRILLTSDKAALLLEMQTKYQSLHILDMCNVWGPLAARLNAIYPEPLPLPPPPGAWKAYGGTIFKHANGKLTGVVSGKTAAKDAPCTGVTVSKAGTFIYQELVGGVAGEATRCVK